MAVALLVARCGAAAALGLFWSWAAFCNAYIVWQRRVRGRTPPSLAPLLGGLAGVAAVLVAPVGTLAVRWPFALVPAVLDAGCLPAIVMFAVAIVRDEIMG